MLRIVSTRFSDELLLEVDDARGEESRSAFVTKAVKHYLRARRIEAMCGAARRTAERDKALAENLSDEFEDGG